MVKVLRLDRFLAEMGVGTRSQVKELIRKGRVVVNEETVRKPEQKVRGSDRVCVDDKPVAYVEYEYLMLNKPAGVVSATEDGRERTVLDLVADAARKDLFPVGRLDKDTEGLLLLTNDGGLAHDLLSPRHHVDKIYFARVDGCVTVQEVRKFKEGLKIGDEKPTMPAELEILTAREASSEVLVTLQEGRFHQVKRMFEAVGMHVLYLRRIAMGPLKLDESLGAGEYRRLEEWEIQSLKGETNV